MSDLQGGPTAKLEPHAYWPNYLSGGDCLHCGNLSDALVHRLAPIVENEPEQGHTVEFWTVADSLPEHMEVHYGRYVWYRYVELDIPNASPLSHQWGIYHWNSRHGFYELVGRATALHAPHNWMSSANQGRDRAFLTREAARAHLAERLQRRREHAADLLQKIDERIAELEAGADMLGPHREPTPFGRTDQ